MWIVSKEALAAIVRRGMPGVYAWLIVQLGGIEWLSDKIVFLPDELTTAQIMALSGAIATIIYAAIRWAAEKWGWLGYLLVVNQKPHYPALENNAPAMVGAHEASSEELPPI